MYRALYSLILLPLAACSESSVAAADHNLAVHTLDLSEPTELSLRAREYEAQYDAIMADLAKQSYSVTRELDRLLDAVCDRQRAIEAQLESIGDPPSAEARAELERSFERLQADLARSRALVGQ